MRYLRIIIDVMLTLTVLPCLFARIIIAPVMGKRKGLPQRKLLVLDMAYTLEMITRVYHLPGFERLLQTRLVRAPVCYADLT